MQEQVLLPIQVKKEQPHYSMPSKDLALMTFSFILSRKLSSHTAAANLADSHYFKVHETGRWETFKHISIEVSKLILALSLPCGELIHTLGGHAVDGVVKGMEKAMKLTKEGMECVEISSGLIGHIKPVDALTHKFERKMRQLFGDSLLSQEEQLKQFASIFASIFPEDLEALQRFMHGLLWRYEEQIEKLSQAGAEQLALAIWVHLQHLFQLDFIEWKENGLGGQLEPYGPQRRDKMLDVMWYWVAKVRFLKVPVKLALSDGQFVKATKLLHHGGYKCSNQNNDTLALDIREWRPSEGEHKGFFETQGAKWGYRRTTDREFIIDQFILELSQCREGIINETGLFTQKTLERYKNSSTTKVKALPFSWKSQSEKIVFLEEEVKVLKETTKDLTGQIKVAQSNVVKVQKSAVEASEKIINLEERLSKQTEIIADLSNKLNHLQGMKGNMPIPTQEAVEVFMPKDYSESTTEIIHNQDENSYDGGKDLIPEKTISVPQIQIFSLQSTEQPATEAFFLSPISQKTSSKNGTNSSVQENHAEKTEEKVEQKNNLGTQ